MPQKQLVAFVLIIQIGPGVILVLIWLTTNETLLAKPIMAE